MVWGEMKYSYDFSFFGNEIGDEEEIDGGMIEMRICQLWNED